MSTEPIKFEIKQINFEIFNLIHSCFQGQFAANNILSQTRHPQFNPDNLTIIKEQIKIALGHLKRIENDELIIDPEFEEVNETETEVFALLSSLKRNFAVAANEIVSIASTEDWTSQPDYYQVLVAYYAWFAYAEENYFKKLQDFYLINNVGEYNETIIQRLDQASNDLKLTGNFLMSIKSPAGPEQGFFSHLMFFIKTLPGYFFSKIHDINQFLTIKQEFTYELAGFSAEEAPTWQAKNFDPIAAGYWKCFGFDADSAFEWLERGFFVAAEAANWKFSEFKSAQAAAWAKYSFTPILALHWQQASLKPEHSAILISHGYFMPGDLPTDPGEVQALIQQGFKKEVN